MREPSAERGDRHILLTGHHTTSQSPAVLVKAAKTFPSNSRFFILSGIFLRDERYEFTTVDAGHCFSLSLLKELKMRNAQDIAANALPSTDGIDRRGMLKCMAWVGTGAVFGVAGGIASSRLLGQNEAATAKPKFSFVQISDSHLGFARDPNKDVAATLKLTVARINALPEPPAFILHTGDITHLAKPDQFDTVAEILNEVKTETGKVFYVPGEHDFEVDGNREYLKRYGKNTRGADGRASTTRELILLDW